MYIQPTFCQITSYLHSIVQTTHSSLIKNTLVGCGYHQLPNQRVTRVHLPRLQPSVLEVDQSPPSSAEVKNMWRYTSIYHGVRKYTFTFTLIRYAQQSRCRQQWLFCSRYLQTHGDQISWSRNFCIFISSSSPVLSHKACLYTESCTSFDCGQLKRCSRLSLNLRKVLYRLYWITDEMRTLANVWYFVPYQWNMQTTGCSRIK